MVGPLLNKVSWFGSVLTKAPELKIIYFRVLDIRFLEDVLNMPVDLVVVNRDSSPYLLCNIFEFGEIIFEYGENFSNWFDKFYDETLINRELYFIYMEEKNRYVQY